jgi:hypothetical protein
MSDACGLFLCVVRLSVVLGLWWPLVARCCVSPCLASWVFFGCLWSWLLCCLGSREPYWLLAVGRPLSRRLLLSRPSLVSVLGLWGVCGPVGPLLDVVLVVLFGGVLCGVMFVLSHCCPLRGGVAVFGAFVLLLLVVLRCCSAFWRAASSSAST